MPHTLRSLILEVILFSVFALGAALTQITPQKPGAPTDQQSRLALMKSRGPDASLTIVPTILFGHPDGRVSEVVGLLFEQQGHKSIEIGQEAFTSEGKVAMAQLSRAFGDFIAKNPITTEYALYVEYTGSPQTGFDGIRAIVVDKNGGVVWTDEVGSKDEAFKAIQPPDPMGFSMFLVRRLGPHMGLTEETAKAAKPGKMAQLMQERSGLPPQSELAALSPRVKEMRGARKSLTLRVFPLRRGDSTDAAGAAALARMITDAGVCKAVPATESILLKSSHADPNEMKVLWDLAREFRDHARGFSPKGEYTLYADYVFNPEHWQQGFVHFVVCDPQGEWVVANLANSDHPDYQSIQPTSVEKCNALLLSRLQAGLKWQISDAVRETIDSAGIAAARATFKALRGNMAEYNLSEGEMNELGYQYLWAKKLQEATAVFAMNVEAFPESFNVYDSLGEAYAAAGDKERAIKNYEKSLQLNPNNQGGIEALKRLKAQ